MKSFCNVLFALTFFCFTAAGQQFSLKSLVGRWQSAEGAGIEVIDSSKIFLTYNGEKKQVVSYETNFSRVPSWFDFTIKDGAEEVQLKSLLLFVNNDLIQWQVFEGDRPPNFSVEKGNMVYLKRAK